MTPTSLSLRRPIADITPSISNQTVINRVVAKGRALSAKFECFLPQQNYHGHRGQNKVSNINSLAPNLMDKFFEETNKDLPSKVMQCKRGCGRPKKIQSDNIPKVFPQSNFELGVSSYLN